MPPFDALADPGTPAGLAVRAEAAGCGTRYSTPIRSPGEWVAGERTREGPFDFVVAVDPGEDPEP